MVSSLSLHKYTFIHRDLKLTLQQRAFIFCFYQSHFLHLTKIHFSGTFPHIQMHFGTQISSLLWEETITDIEFLKNFKKDLKALTDHFGGGSRVVSFDPYS